LLVKELSIAQEMTEPEVVKQIDKIFKV